MNISHIKKQLLKLHKKDLNILSHHYNTQNIHLLAHQIQRGFMQGNLLSDTVLQDRFIANISKQAQDAIKIYTGASGYRINHYLREHWQLEGEDQWVVNQLDKLFSDVPPLKTSITVWRDMDLELHDHKQEGYVSTSLNSDQLDSDELDLDNKHAKIQCCQYQITVPVGSKVLPVKKWSVNKNENEIILPRGSYYKYTGREIKHGAIWIYLTLIDALDEIKDIKIAVKQQSERERKIAEVAAYIIQLLQSGELQQELADENELFDDGEGTTLQEYVQQKVSSIISSSEVPDVLELINLANYTE